MEKQAWAWEERDDNREKGEAQNGRKVDWVDLRLDYFPILILYFSAAYDQRCTFGIRMQYFSIAIFSTHCNRSDLNPANWKDTAVILHSIPVLLLLLVKDSYAFHEPYNWSATKQRLHPQSVAEISRHSVLSGDRIRQCETSLMLQYK